MLIESIGYGKFLVVAMISGEDDMSMTANIGVHDDDLARVAGTTLPHHDIKAM